jgi:hypothetical protein
MMTALVAIAPMMVFLPLANVMNLRTLMMIAGMTHTWDALPMTAKEV